MPELRTARENARLEIGSQRGRNSHQIGVLGIYDLQGLSYGRTELLVAVSKRAANGHLRTRWRSAGCPVGGYAGTGERRRGYRQAGISQPSQRPDCWLCVKHITNS